MSIIIKKEDTVAAAAVQKQKHTEIMIHY